MEQLVAYDPHLVVGILGGAAGTTYDAFKMLAEAHKYGARAALYGRKINSAECQLGFIEMLRLIADRQISPEEAVRAYHGVLQRLKIRPNRPLEEDSQLQSGIMSYGGPTSVAVPRQKLLPRSQSGRRYPAKRRQRNRDQPRPQTAWYLKSTTAVAAAPIRRSAIATIIQRKLPPVRRTASRDRRSTFRK